MKALRFVARFPGPVQGHAINTIKKFYPALQADHDFDDLMQEAFIVFIKCKRKYEATVDGKAWFMCIYRTALRNRLINMAARVRPCIALDEIPEQATELDEGYFRTLIGQLPVEVCKLVEAVCEGRMVDGRFALAKIKTKYPKLF